MAFRYPFLLIIILFLYGNIHAQPRFRQDYFAPPIKLKMFLSGSFGELRTNHFHSGIDIKTQGVSGHKVYASAEGYISRIKIEAAGYGNTLYITHPGGYTTVYAHLERFRQDISDYVKNIQYKQEKHPLNIYPEKEKWRVEKEDHIAYSGTSGYSFGPHLHFEIRNAGNQAPMNVLLFGFDIEDDVAPRVFSLYIYPMDRESHVNDLGEKQRIGVVADSGGYKLANGQELRVNGRIGFGIEAFDYLNGARNRCGIYSIKMMVNGQLQFHWEMNQFTFLESRYINAYIDFEENKTNNKLVQRTFLEPNNRLGLYKYVKDEGIHDFSIDKSYQVRFILEDAYANHTELSFTVRGGQVPSVSPKYTSEDYVEKFSWSQVNEFSREDLELNIPAKALYDDLNFTYDKSPAIAGSYSPVHHLHHANTPLHLYCDLAIRPDSLPEELRDKAYLGYMNGEGGKTEAAGGEWRDGMVRARIRSFGRYTVLLDTIAPDIRPLNLNETRNMGNKSSIRFRIRDQQSGIKSYEAYVDNKWVLVEYDLKNNLAFYRFDPARLKRGQNHELELYVIDNKDNIAYYYIEFYW